MTVPQMARHAHVGARTFARRFRIETGTTPFRWLTAQRLLYARRLLESTELPIEDIASRSGFGSAAALRDHLRRELSTSPTGYRRAWSSSAFEDR